MAFKPAFTPFNTQTRQQQLFILSLFKLRLASQQFFFFFFNYYEQDNTKKKRRMRKVL